MNIFHLKSDYQPTTEQEKAIKKLIKNYKSGKNYQVLLGVTGSGKTFIIANIIERLQLPALIISHNKTLAAQLYQEFRDFFPDNGVSYFVSYYDYYQPEAYIPSTDTYIEKDADINESIDKLRLLATTNILTRKDVIVVASVSCIYNIGSPKEYGNFIIEFSKGSTIDINSIIKKLIDLQYERGEFGFHRGTFRIIGETLDIFPAYLDLGVKINIFNNKILKISYFDPVNGKIQKQTNDIIKFTLYPAKHYITDPNKNIDVFKNIENDMKKQVKYFLSNNKTLEAHRISQKVKYDLEMIKEVGYVKGIENYSRYFDRRVEGDPPYSLINYYNETFNDNWLLIIDESHITLPQIRGMYNGDYSRKKTLIDYGFRLPAAMDNRPLKFDEFLRIIPGFIASSATPSDYEISMSEGSIVEQLHRPTGIPDPKIIIRPTKNQVDDVIKEIKKRVFNNKKKSRVLVTTLTKTTAEDLAAFMKNIGINVAYIHSDIETLERTDILDKLRRGDYDCIVGVNLLREGLDLPEVSLVAILDADKEGFLRSKVTLIQTMGRAARNSEGIVILYADKITNSIFQAVKEVKRRRKYQLKINKKLGITPTSIIKPYLKKIVENKVESLEEKIENNNLDFDSKSLTPVDKIKFTKKLRKEMRLAAQNLDFELAINLRDKLKELS